MFEFPVILSDVNLLHCGNKKMNFSYVVAKLSDPFPRKCTIYTKNQC
jgi:hypothetical protein